MTPILVADGTFDSAAVAGRFRAAVAKVDGDIVRLVLERLATCPGSGAHGADGTGETRPL